MMAQVIVRKILIVITTWIVCVMKEENESNQLTFKEEEINRNFDKLIDFVSFRKP